MDKIKRKKKTSKKDTKWVFVIY